VNAQTNQNQPPSVNAGSDQTITGKVGGTSITVTGVVTDDNLPNPPGHVTTLWSQVSGPAQASFNNADAISTPAFFSTPGVYVLRLTADDGALTASDDVTITFNLSNQPPVVSAGPDQSIVFPAPATLNGSATDDGLPNPPGALTTLWSKVSGPGTVSFANKTVLDTSASFSQPGTYVLDLNAQDGALSSDSKLTITVMVANTPPVVDAGSDVIIAYPGIAILHGNVSDDGLPNNLVTVTWSMVSGPGSVVFSAPTSVDTTASFSTPGSYTLRLTADDGLLSASANVIVSVNAGVSEQPNQTSNRLAFSPSRNEFLSYIPSSNSGGNLTATVYTRRGERLTDIFSGTYSAGQALTWDGRQGMSKPVSSGVYILKLSGFLSNLVKFVIIE